MPQTQWEIQEEVRRHVDLKGLLHGSAEKDLEVIVQNTIGMICMSITT